MDLFAINKTAEFFSNKEDTPITQNKEMNMNTIILFVLGFVICIGTAYLAYCCNHNETPATRALYTIFAFLFSGIYLVYYFIYHVILGKKCGSGKDISNIVRNYSKK
jgi:quinol-cytochrome oxidoreductase complex cytochrome b subunit